MWGTSIRAKILHNLSNELSNGDSVLSHPPLLRIVFVVALHLGNACSATLIKSFQLLFEGRIRHDDHHLLEKMVPRESIEVVAHGAIREELGKKVKTRLVMESYKVEIETEEHGEEKDECESYDFGFLKLSGQI